MLQSFRCCRLWTLLATLWASHAANLLAAQPSESLLPPTTKGYLSLVNFDACKTAFEQTQIGQLLNDPKMQPFVQDFQTQIKERWLSTHHSLGLTLNDLEGVPGGELCFAIIQPGPGKYAIAIVIDTTGRDEAASKLIQKVTTNLTGLKATRVASKAKEITAFKLPTNTQLPTQRNHQSAFFHVNNTLVFCDSIEELETIHARLGKDGATALQSLPAYKNVVERVKTADLGKLGVIRVAPHARWFAEPFGYIEANRAMNPPKKFTKTHPDMVRVLKSEGFNCIQGLGGYVNFMADFKTGKYDIFHRTSVYAPPGPKGYQRAARMLRFPNGGALEPQPWVPRELATYTSFNLEIQNAFEMSKTLVNALAGEGPDDDMFEEVLKGLRDQVGGPRIDIRKDLIGNLGQRVTILGDYQLPITTKSERVLFVVEIKQNEKDVAELVRKAVKGERHRELKFEDQTIWELVNEDDPKKDNTSTEIQISGLDEIEVVAPPKKKNDDDKNALPNSAMCVAYGNLFVGTHVDIVKKILKSCNDAKKGPIASLGQSADFQVCQDHLNKLGAGNHCATIFSRTDEEYRTTYEMIRQGKMPQAETMLAKLLNAMMTDPADVKSGTVRQQKIHGEKLPEYDVARRYLGPSAAYAISEPDGWMVIGFVITKDAPAAEVVRAEGDAAGTK